MGERRNVFRNYRSNIPGRGSQKAKACVIVSVNFEGRRVSARMIVVLVCVSCCGGG